MCRADGACTSKYHIEASILRFTAKQKSNAKYNWRVRGIKISFEQYEEMRKNHHGRCDICGRKKRLDLDHDHKTGKVLGLLCRLCNLKLGYWQIFKPQAEKYLGRIRVGVPN